MAKAPQHILDMLDRCAEDEHLQLTASCGCRVGTVIYRGEKLPLVEVCPDHQDDLREALEPDAPIPAPKSELLN